MIAGLILAAGKAARFGSDKRQALTADGESLLAAVLRRYTAAYDQLAVVVKPDDAFGVATCAQFGATVVENALCEQGLGTSVAAGIRWAQQANAEAVMIGLADMPFVQSATLVQLGERLLQTRELVVPVHLGEPGHPRGIPCQYFERLQDLDGERGAGAVLDWSTAIRLPTSDEGTVLDIDTPAMLARASR
ncbi:nucleotidyltransferase family protein [Chitinimonas naiadis]